MPQRYSKGSIWTYFAAAKSSTVSDKRFGPQITIISVYHNLSVGIPLYRLMVVGARPTRAHLFKRKKRHI